MSVYDDWQHWLDGAGALVQLAELHGLISGYVAGAGSLDAASLRALMADVFEARGAVEEQSLADLLALANALREQMQGIDCDYYPAVEDAAGDGSTGALALWCESFLQGITQSGLKGDFVFSEIGAEALRDIAAMAQVEEVELDEEAERDWVEIVEYLRVAVLTLNEERNARGGDAGAQAPESVH